MNHFKQITPMKQKIMYQKARMFSVELSNQSQLLSGSSPVSGSSAEADHGMQHGSYTQVAGGVFQ